MTSVLDKAYSPQEAEPVVRDRWDQSRAFHAAPRDGGEPFCILIPPPNVTAALHLGHALNNTLQDVLTRYHRMRGCNTLWMPGTDHAGIATQTVVEKRLLQEEGKRRTDYTRDEFIDRVQSWKDEYETTITGQLKAMGCSCDWERQRFTMDDVCARAVREAFFRLFKDGLIYRGKRLVNWDPVTQTALADDEVEMEEVQGHMYYLRYPLVHPSENPDDPLDCQEVTWSELATRGYPGAADHPDEEIAWLTVATTRPETYLGDTAVAVNPADPRAASLRGLYVQIPLVGRVIPVVEDEYVVLPDPNSGDAKAQFATGFLKVTPAHDPNDYDIGGRHDLPMCNVLAPDATISDSHGWDDVGDAHLFVGLSREDARAKVVREFDARGLLEAKREYTHSVGHSYRSHVPIEPYLSDQWYVKVSDDRLVGEAQRALADEQYDGAKPAREDTDNSADADGSLSFYPARYAKTYQAWHDNLRDWCISRQLWWGHRIPVWTKRSENDERLDQKIVEWWERIAAENEDRMAAQIAADHINVCFAPDADDLIQQAVAEGFVQDPDVLDTWFSSALWPISTMGWPEPSAFPYDVPEGDALLETFNPSNVLCTGRDIITLWVSRMVMFNRYFRDGKLPYRHVYINPMIQDGHGQRMSKSLGNGVDPRDIIHSHGADALRYVLVQLATSTQDCRMPVDMVCPHCEHTFHPKEATSPAGYRVAAAEQTCPSCGKEMTSAYGAASGAGKVSNARPLARNASSRFDLGRNFCNKLWNATRFALTHLTDAAPEDQGIGADALPLPDKWIISRLHRTLHTVEDALAQYQFNTYAEAMYDFIWRDLCDWYLEAIKPSVKSDPNQQQVLRTVLNAALRLLHPICPFVTETLWPHVHSSGRAGLDGITLGQSELLATAPWPDIRCSVDDKAAHDRFDRIRSLVEAIRTVRGEHNVGVRRTMPLYAPGETLELVGGCDVIVSSLAGLSEIHPFDQRSDDAAAFLFEGAEHAVGGVITQVDRLELKSRLESDITNLRKQIAQREARLANPGYTEKAPAHLVDQTRAELSQFQEELKLKRRDLEGFDD